MSDKNTDPGNRSAREIEREVDRIRANITASVEALQDRFSIETIVGDVVRAVSKNGGEVGRNLGCTVRDNPLPLLLTGVGLAWLIAGSNKSPDTRDRTGTSARPDFSNRTGLEISRSPVATGSSASSGADFVGLERPDPTRHLNVDNTLMSAEPSSRDFQPVSSSPSMSGRALDAADSLKENASALGYGAMNQVNRVRRGVSGMGGDLGSRAEVFIEDQPLIVAALGFAVGLGIGGFLPSSRVEDDLLGAKSDALKASVKGIAEEQVEKVQAVAGAVVDEGLSMADEVVGKLDESTPSGADMVSAAKLKVMSAVDRLKDAGIREVKKHDRDDGAK